MALPSWGLEYFNEAAAAGLSEWAEDSREEIFALQEFEAVKGAKPERFSAKGDSSLYAGVMSLLKAFAYEVAALQERRGKENERLVYQFNLVQVLDGPLYEASFATGEPQVSGVDRYRYFARTMLNGQQLSSRIDFCTREAFPNVLQDMAKLHRFNAKHFPAKRKYFFDHVTELQSRLDALLPLFEPRITSAYKIYEPEAQPPKAGWVRLAFEKQVLVIYVDCALFAERLAENKGFMASAARSISDLYRYSGPIRVDDDILF